MVTNIHHRISSALNTAQQDNIVQNGVIVWEQRLWNSECPPRHVIRCEGMTTEETVAMSACLSDALIANGVRGSWVSEGFYFCKQSPDLDNNSISGAYARHLLHLVDAAFRDLEKQKIVCVADSYNEDVVMEMIEQDLRTDGLWSDRIGFCLYLEEDADLAAERGWLRLEYGDMDYQFDESLLDIAPGEGLDDDAMIAVFNRHGLEVDLIIHSDFIHEMRVRLQTDYESVIWADSQSKLASSDL